jgi:putative phage-type endonuclease
MTTLNLRDTNILQESENEIYDLIEEYLEDNIQYFFQPEFQEKMSEDITAFLEIESKMEDLREWIDACILHFYKLYDIPLRQYTSSTNDDILLENNIQIPFLYTYQTKENLQKQLDFLENYPKIKQRTEEWYQIRHNCFSASNIWKLLDSTAQINSLIYEKCNPIKSFQHHDINKNNSMSWGIKYEPLSIQVYEYKHPGKKVNTNYGCILHPKYSFIGASPDGINISETDPHFGRMVEVKNIYNREITGIPLEEYWIQMQIQMETCGLEECDFLETRFKEYETETAFYEDVLSEYKGIILYFLQKPNADTSFFEYMPLNISLEKYPIDKWIESQKEKYEKEYVLYEKIYWKLDEYSCVLVERNHLWFDSVLPKIRESWKIVEDERITGFQHRAPKKREKKGFQEINTTTITPILTTTNITTISILEPENMKIENPEEIPKDVKVVKLS